MAEEFKDDGIAMNALWLNSYRDSIDRFNSRRSNEKTIQETRYND